MGRPVVLAASYLITRMLKLLPVLRAVALPGRTQQPRHLLLQGAQAGRPLVEAGSLGGALRRNGGYLAAAAASGGVSL